MPNSNQMNNSQQNIIPNNPNWNHPPPQNNYQGQQNNYQTQPNNYQRSAQNNYQVEQNNYQTPQKNYQVNKIIINYHHKIIINNNLEMDFPI